MGSLSQNVTHASLAPSEFVRQVETRDGVALLDIHQNLCLSLTPIGAKIWNLLKQSGNIDQLLDCMVADFPDVPAQQIRDDVTDFLANLRHKRLLSSTTPSERRPGVFDCFIIAVQHWRAFRRTRCTAWRLSPGLLFWKALMGFALFDALRLHNSFPRLHFYVRQWQTSHITAPDDMVERVGHAIKRAAAWYPKRMLCLQRSAVTTCLLRLCGVDAFMVIGAQKLPFKAHAWTEVNGQALNEPRDVKAFYLIWERC